MAVSKGYKVRPSTERELRDVFKIFLSPANLLLLGMKPGDLCDVKTSEDYVAPAIAWNAKEKIKDDIVQTSSALQKLYSFKLDERISVISSHDSCEKATNITFCELQNDSVNHSLPILNILTEADRHFWARVLQCSLDRDGQSSGLTITPGLVFENVEVQGRKKSFQVLNVNSSDRRMLYYAQSTCEVYITTQATREDEDRVLFVSGDGLGGLRSQLKQINDTLRSYCEPFQSHSHPREFLACKGFILLYGASRTGKSLVLRKISEASWQGVFRIERSMLYESSSEKDSAVTRIFSSALNAQPSLIIIDDLDSPDAKGIVHDFGRPLNVELLGEQMDRLGVHRTLVVGAATRLSDVDPRLRQDERFAQEIEIPVPDSVSRGEILKVLADLPKEASHPLLDSIAGRTHGFVAGDLKRLLNQAIRLYQVRKGMLSPEAELKDTAKNGPGFIHADMELDFKNALSNVHPSAMHNIFVEPPNVRWTDIGGQHKVKKILEKAVVWPLTHSELMKTYGATPKKGLLLYGPPGCSKTMVAKATATESGLNFIAVRGPELVRMYVGESERALREVFSKARAVKPSIVFLDEIDAIGARRETNQHVAVQTVTTLLNELDGYEAMEDVFVLAATNSPETLDPALLRPGRLDVALYVGLPDFEARRDILRTRMLSMPLGRDIDDNALTEGTEGFSGADIVEICEQARWTAMEEERLVSQEHFTSALAEAQKSVSMEMVKRYEAWGASRR